MRTAEEIYADRNRKKALEYYYANRERCRERANAYYYENKERILEERKKPRKALWSDD